MAKHYVSTDRMTPFLMPPSLLDWLPPDHLAWFVLSVVDKLKQKTWKLHGRHPNWGPGRAAYDPEMLLTLLFYAYCTGVYSSRAIEAACKVDVAFRVIAANQVPDHATIARFRAEQAPQIRALFSDILMLCQAAGLTIAGTVALDGTKIRARASLRANRTKKQIAKELAELKAEATKKAAELVSQGELADAEDDQRLGQSRGDELPEHLIEPGSREAHLNAALELVNQRHADALDAERQGLAERTERRRETARRAPRVDPRLTTRDQPTLPEAEADLEVAKEQAEAVKARRQAVEAEAAAQGRKPGGRHPNLDRGVAAAQAQLAEAAAQDAARAAEEKINTTDPASAIMVDQAGRYLQAFNAQALVSSDQIIVGAQVTTCAADTGSYQPMVVLGLANLELAGITDSFDLVLADAGYLSTANLTAAGPPRMIATSKAYKLRHQQAEEGYRVGDPPEGCSPIDAMTHRLLTEEGVAAYAQRQYIVEPVFGQIKWNRHYRQFLRMGEQGANDEWILLAMCNNLLKLYGKKHSPRMRHGKAGSPATSGALRSLRRVLHGTGRRNILRRDVLVAA
ncbi:MAG TPA: transposase [Actinomycetota bacterium]|nr:transposase [Actinomycetota bacterium]